jgi:phosphoglycerate dehydrogenase-like enzyme
MPPAMVSQGNLMERGPMLPAKDELVICFAHVAYRLHERFSALDTDIRSFAVRDPKTLKARVGEAHVLVVSGLWQNGLLDRAARLRLIQSIGAGTDQFPREELARRGIRLASARGVNYRAVAEHAMALILALSRRLPEARDNQARRGWRGMIGDPSRREDELGGKTLLIIGLGQIGGRLAQLAKAFDMRVEGVRLHPAAGRGAADAVHAVGELRSLLPEADFVALTCPLTPETENLIDAEALARMKPSAYLVNVARGRVVDEAALIEALAAGHIAGAGLDVTAEEPLAASSPLWEMAQVLITPHTAGETSRYEDNVIEILRDNLERLWRGEQQLRNQVV